MFRKALWNRGGASSSALTAGLPDERKTLAERYTIDAEEAERRTRSTEKEQARREAAQEQARRATEHRVRRDAEARFEAEEWARREAEQQARREADERARRDAAKEQARRHTAEAQARRDAAEERARFEASRVEELAAHRPEPRQADQPAEEPDQTGEAIPIYRWVQRSGPAPAGDWTRSLVEAEDDARRAGTRDD